MNRKALKKSLCLILQNRPEILFAMLYGSAAEGDSFRDVDIGLWIDRKIIPRSKELSYLFGLMDELEELIPYPVDLQLLNEARLTFRYNVSRGQVLLVNDERLFYHFLERTWDDYLDFEPIAMQYIREIAGHARC